MLTSSPVDPCDNAEKTTPAFGESNRTVDCKKPPPEVTVVREDSDIVIDVIDNGTGLPKENRNRLLEPYFTTREKGTGLGLAIVGRILEEHGGRIEFNDAPADWGRGAWARLRFSAQHLSVEELTVETRKAASDR